MLSIDLHCDCEPGSALAAVLLEHVVVCVTVGLHVGGRLLASAYGAGYAQEDFMECHDVWDYLQDFNEIIDLWVADLSLEPLVITFSVANLMI